LNKISRIKGTQDILPEQISVWEHVESVVKETMTIFNYKEIRTPVFEKTELFARGIGEATDIVSKEMYTFADRGRKNLTLKPEMTAPVIRAYIEHNLLSKSPLQKLFYFAPLFRQENPQAGRLRQFHQFGAEAIGSGSPFLDSELIILAMNIYKKLGLKNLKLNLNSVGTPSDRIKYKELLKSYIQPNLDKYCPDCQKRFENNTLRILDCKNQKCIELNANAPLLSDHLSESSVRHFNYVKMGLKEQNYIFDINPYLVRGLDYYTHTVFEITSSSLGSQDAVCGGGRYDLLSKELGGPDVAAVGFASGIERLHMIMESQNLHNIPEKKLQVYISPLGEDAIHIAAGWLQKIRNEGYRAEMDYMNRSIKAQMRDANRQNAQIVLILGSEEIQSKSFSLKEMEKGNQKNIEFDSLFSHLRQFFRSNK